MILQLVLRPTSIIIKYVFFFLVKCSEHTFNGGEKHYANKHIII